VVENFGIGSSVTISNNSLSLTPTSDLSEAQVYHLSYPSGVITNMAGESYVGTAYTFKSLAYDYKLYAWGGNGPGSLGQNNRTSSNSPVQIVGTTWSKIRIGSHERCATLALKNDGTMWSWGYNVDGQTGQNGANPAMYAVSSPTQLPGTTWSNNFCGGKASVAVKTDGTLWCWGNNSTGSLGQNNKTQYSSPVQVGSDTTWSTTYDQCAGGGDSAVFAIKTDGTLWGIGKNGDGELGQGNLTKRSSPIQIPGTTWKHIDIGYSSAFAIKTDGTLWSWGWNNWGNLGQNNRTYYSSPKQIPGTDWSKVRSSHYYAMALKTDGTLWSWGRGNWGSGAYNISGSNAHRSSPVQVPGTTWNNIAQGNNHVNFQTRTDGTLWAWGNNQNGQLGQGNNTQYSSPVQIPGTDWNYALAAVDSTGYAIQKVEP